MTPEQRDELDRSTQLFHIALVQLGAQAVEDTLSLWQDVPPIPTSGGSRATERWLATAVTYVMRRRLRSRDLALAYYRYQRALATGSTIPRPGEDPPPFYSLFELKKEFEALLPQSAETPPEAPVSSLPAQETQVVSQAGTADASGSQAVDQPTDTQVDDADRILVDEIAGLEAEMAEAERIAEMQVEDALKALGPDTMDRKMDAIHPDSANQVDGERQDAHKQAGNRQAATAARQVMNGARGSLFHIGARDPKVIGYVRVSRTGTPCGWCAMLISRGFVPKTGSSLFKSSQGSGVQGDGSVVTFGDLDLYHDNCQCYAVPIYSREQLTGDAFALNRKYADLWPIVTKGLGGKSAISAWRRFIRQEAESQKPQVAAA